MVSRFVIAAGHAACLALVACGGGSVRTDFSWSCRWVESGDQGRREFNVSVTNQSGRQLTNAKLVLGFEGMTKDGHLYRDGRGFGEWFYRDLGTLEAGQATTISISTEWDASDAEMQRKVDVLGVRRRSVRHYVGMEVVSEQGRSEWYTDEFSDAHGGHTLDSEN